MHLKICHIGGYEGKILSDAPNYLMDNCAAAKIRYFSMSYIILLNNIRLFNFFVSVYYD